MKFYPRSETWVPLATASGTRRRWRAVLPRSGYIPQPGVVRCGGLPWVLDPFQNTNPVRVEVVLPHRLTLAPGAMPSPLGVLFLSAFVRLGSTTKFKFRNRIRSPVRALDNSPGQSAAPPWDHVPQQNPKPCKGDRFLRPSGDLWRAMSSWRLGRKCPYDSRHYCCC
jgi:hypothetical protein